MTYRLNRRLLLRETQRASRGDAQSRGGLNTIGFGAGAPRSHGDLLENFKNRDVEVFQGTERGSINPEQKRVSKPAMIHMQACVSADDEMHC